MSPALSSLTWEVLPYFQTGGPWASVVLSLLFCVERGQDRYLSTTESLSDTCQDETGWRKTLVGLKWRWLVQVGSSTKSPLPSSQ